AQGAGAGVAAAVSAGAAVLAGLLPAAGGGRGPDGGGGGARAGGALAGGVALALRDGGAVWGGALGAHRPDHGGQLHAAGGSGAVRAAGAGAAVHGARLRRPAPDVRGAHRAVVRWLAASTTAARLRTGPGRPAEPPRSARTSPPR